MKIFAISDLHISSNGDKPMEVFGARWDGYIEKIQSDWAEKVTDDDVVLISGDLSWAMKLEDAVADLKTFAHLKGKKVIIKGNHDYWWNGITKVRNALPDNFYALQNDAIKLGNYVICGSRGWTLENMDNEQDKKIVMREVERFKLTLKDAVKLREEGDKLIVLIHYPPFDLKRNPSVFTELFEEFGVSCVIYGHLHGKDCKAEKVYVKNNIPYYLASCDLIGHKLLEIKL